MSEAVMQNIAAGAGSAGGAGATRVADLEVALAAKEAENVELEGENLALKDKLRATRFVSDCALEFVEHHLDEAEATVMTLQGKKEEMEALVKFARPDLIKRGGKLTKRPHKKVEKPGEYKRRIRKLLTLLKLTKKEAIARDDERRDEELAHQWTKYDLDLTTELMEASLEGHTLTMKGNREHAQLGLYAIYRPDFLEDINLPHKGVHAHVSHSLAMFFLPTGNPNMSPKTRFRQLEQQYVTVETYVRQLAAYGTHEAFLAAFMQHLIATA